ncbi:hypothetical protein FI667_g2922, partial [Globisporangium splendens]
MAHQALWLYDVDDEEDACIELGNRQEKQELLDVVDKLSYEPQLRGEQKLIDGQVCVLVRCRGVHANGAPCSRTSWLPVNESDKTSKANRYCYRHRYQQSDLRTDSALPNVTSSPRTLTFSRLKVCVAMCCSVLSVICFAAGVYKQDASLCLIGAIGTWCSAVAMCIVACEILCYALPTALAAQLTIDSLQTQLAHMHPTALSGNGNAIEDRIARIA